MKNKKNKKIVISSDHEYEFDYKGIENKDGIIKHELYYSKASHWSDHIKGTLAISIIEDGDSLILDREISKIDYSQANYLKILLNIIFEKEKELILNNK
jgi:hypothetical protein